ncbi:polyprenyl synthetase family protein [Lachnospiraceae bacterium 29-84]
MIICLTGFSCTGKTTASKLIATQHNFSVISVREVSHEIAQSHGYSRTREWLKKISTADYLLECRKSILANLRYDNQDYIIDDLFDLQLWNDIKDNFDSVLISLSATEQSRSLRMVKRENRDELSSLQELSFLDGCKQSFGIDSVIHASSFTISVDDCQPSEVADLVYRYAIQSTSGTLFKDDLDLYRKTIDQAICGNYVTDLLQDLKQMSEYTEAFLKYCKGGKRIRAYLVKLGYEICGNEFDERIIVPSLSYELFQTGVLIHDDIIDESTTRRNLPTMHVMLGNNHTALSKAICIGDIGILLATEIIAKSDFDCAIIEKAIVHQSKVFKLTIAGELKDIGLSENSLYALDDIITMYELKTSWYTIIGPLQLGAILGNATPEVLTQLEKVGSAMGIAFQIKDDILGIFGEVDVIGKSNLSDMQEGKKTILTEHFINHASTAEKEEFASIYGHKESGSVELLRIQKLLKDSYSYAYAIELCRKYIEDAKSTIFSMQISNYHRQILLGFLNYLDSRQF